MSLSKFRSKRDKWSKDETINRKFLEKSDLPVKKGVYVCLDCGFKTHRKMTFCWRCGGKRVVYAPPIGDKKKAVGRYYSLQRMWE